MKTSLLFLFAVCVAGCAHTQGTLSVAPVGVDAAFDASEVAIYYATQRTLVQEGYLLARTNQETGSIATHAHRVELTSDQVACPNTMHPEPLADERIPAAVSFSARVRGNTLVLWADVQAAPGVGRKEKTPSCTSSGLLERTLVAKIRANLAA